MHISDESQIRFVDHAEGSKWTAAMSQRYKLVLGTFETPPYLLDTTADPNELTNSFQLNHLGVTVVACSPLSLKGVLFCDMNLWIFAVPWRLPKGERVQRVFKVFNSIFTSTQANVYYIGIDE